MAAGGRKEKRTQQERRFSSGRCKTPGERRPRRGTGSPCRSGQRDYLRHHYSIKSDGGGKKEHLRENPVHTLAAA